MRTAKELVDNSSKFEVNGEQAESGWFQLRNPLMKGMKLSLTSSAMKGIVGKAAVRS